MSDWRTIEEAAELLRVRPGLLKEKARRGLLPVLRLGRRTIRVDMNALRPTTDDHQPTQAEAGPRIRRRRRSDLPPVTDEMGD
jgi:hypothetical protein